MLNLLKHTATHLGLLAFFAVLLALAYPHPGWWPLVYIALIPFGLVVAFSRRTLTQLWTTLLVSQVWWMFMLWWLSEVTFGGMTALALAMAIYWTFAAVMTNAIHRRWPRLPMTLLLPAVWITVELLRSTWPTGGFSWFCLAHVIMPWKPEHGVSYLAQIADVFSQYGVSFLLAMPAGAVVDWVLAREARKANREVESPTSNVEAPKHVAVPLTSNVLLLVLFVACFGYGSMSLPEAETQSRDQVVIGIVQTNVPQSSKNRPTYETEKAMWDQLVKLTMEVMAREPRPEIVVWPETCVPAPLNPEGVATSWQIVAQWRGVTPAMLAKLPPEEQDYYREIADRFGVPFEQLPAYLTEWYSFKATRPDALNQIAKQLQVDLLVGAPTVVSSEPSERYNSVYYVSQARGLDSLRFDKMHRVPFGEYLPWVELVPAVKQWFITYLTPHDRDYSLQPGKGPVVFNVATSQGEVPVVTPICFEDAFPRVCRQLVYDTETGTKQATIMINVTNDGWYPGTAQGPQHMQLATLRCIETRTPMIRSVNTGISGYINAAGGIDQLVITDGELQQVTGTASRPVPLSDRSSWYGRNGLWPIWIVAITVLGMYVEALVASFRLRRKREQATQ